MHVPYYFKEKMMPLRNTPYAYGSLSKFFHWTIALAVILMLCIGVSFGYLPKGDFKNFLVTVHKSLGMTIACLAALFLLWGFINPKPVFPMHMRRWEVRAARWTHGLLYLILILMPLSGLIMSLASGYPVKFWWLFTVKLSWISESKGLADTMWTVHQTLAWIITTLIAIHTLAALKHYFFDKDDVLARMWPKKKRKNSLFH